jgi:N-acetyl sugar amidotransferase
MKRCNKCLYPETTKPFIVFDEEGICSGCRVSEEKQKINWEERALALKELIDPYKTNNNYDCIIPVSGGKDSTFQTHYAVKELGLNPLLVTFNHLDNSDVGIRNLENLVIKFGLDHIRFTPSPETIRKTSRHAFYLMGDPFWHEHAGIYTFPVQVAIEKKIPLILWGEYGYMDLMGMYGFDDFIEMSRKNREEHGMRGYSPEKFIEGNKEGLKIKDISWSIYPSDEEIEKIGLRGLYLGNYINWDSIKQTRKMIDLYDFETDKKERTFNIYENAECYFNDTVHDYKKFFKFGYGRATDHASQLIRLGYITREQGLELIKHYDVLEHHEKLIEYLEWIGISLKEWNKKMLEERSPQAMFFSEKGNISTETDSRLRCIFKSNKKLFSGNKRRIL